MHLLALRDALQPCDIWVRRELVMSSIKSLLFDGKDEVLRMEPEVALDVWRLYGSRLSVIFRNHLAIKLTFRVLLFN